MRTRIEEREARRQERIHRELAQGFDNDRFEQEMHNHFRSVVGLTKFALIAGVVITLLVIALLAVLLVSLI